MKKQITTNDAPQAPAILSQAIENGNLVFVAGQIHTKTDGSLVEGSTEEKVAQIMKNIEAILKAAKCDLNNIVKVVIYVTDMALMPDLNKVYPTYFSEPLPVREAVCVKELPLGAQIEISVMAAKG
jgi:2-iminobutanoate/2-iminopropanoate deaminase